MTELAFGDNPLLEDDRPKLAFGENPVLPKEGGPELAFGSSPAVDLPQPVDELDSQDRGVLSDIGESMKRTGRSVKKGLVNNTASGFYNTAANVVMLARQGVEFDEKVDAEIGARVPSLLQIVDSAVTAIVEKVGGDRINVLEATEKSLRQLARETAGSPIEDQSLGERIIEGVASAPGQVLQFAISEAMLGPLGFPTLAALQEADRGPVESAKAALGAFTIGRVLKSTKGQSTPRRAGTVGAVGAAETAARGGDIQDIAASGATFAILGAVGNQPGPRRQGSRPAELPERQEVTERPIEQRPKVEVLESGIVRARDVEVVQAEGREFLKESLTRRTEAATRAGNINLENINAPGDAKALLQDLSQRFKDFPEARRGRQSIEETNRLAEEIGLTPEKLLKRRKGQAFNAEETQAARQLLQEVRVDLENKRQRAIGGSDNDLAAFDQAMLRFVAVMEQVDGATAEAGRTLRIYRERIGGTSLADLKNLQTLIRSRGGRDKLEDLAEKLGDITDPENIAKFARKATKPKLTDQILEVWINWGLLSNPVTHAANVSGNTLMAVQAGVERGVAAGISGGRNVPFSEATARTFGMIQGAKEGVRLAARAFITEEPSEGSAKIEARRFQAIPSKQLGTVTLPGGAELPIEVGGKQVRLPGRALLAGDELFKAINYRGELHALAARLAHKEGLRGEARDQRIAEIIDNPPETIHLRAIKESAENVFVNPLGEFGQAVQKMANSNALAKVVLPFVRTPVNIVKSGLKRTPAGIFMESVRADIRAGLETGASKDAKAARDIALARMAVGTSLMVTAAYLAEQGFITGSGPSNPNERRGKMLMGWKPYSFKVGDEYFSFARVEPAGILLGLAADFSEIRESMTQGEADKLGAMILASAAKNLTNKTFLQGLTNMIRAFDDPDRFSERFIQNLAGTLVPAVSAQVARNIDPIIRDTQTIVDRWKSRIPFLSKTVPAFLNLWGEEIKRGGALGPDWLSPIYISKVKNDRVSNEIARLGVSPSMPRRKINDVDLTPKQYNDYVKLAGQPAKQELDRIVAGSLWRRIPDFSKAKLIRDSIRKNRDRARDIMTVRNPELLEGLRTRALRAVGR